MAGSDDDDADEASAEDDGDNEEEASAEDEDDEDDEDEDEDEAEDADECKVAHADGSVRCAGENSPAVGWALSGRSEIEADNDSG